MQLDRSLFNQTTNPVAIGNKTSKGQGRAKLPRWNNIFNLCSYKSLIPDPVSRITTLLKVIESRASFINFLVTYPMIYHSLVLSKLHLTKKWFESSCQAKTRHLKAKSIVLEAKTKSMTSLRKVVTVKSLVLKSKT